MTGDQPNIISNCTTLHFEQYVCNSFKALLCKNWYIFAIYFYTTVVNSNQAEELGTSKGDVRNHLDWKGNSNITGFYTNMTIHSFSFASISSPYTSFAKRLYAEYVYKLIRCFFLGLFIAKYILPAKHRLHWCKVKEWDRREGYSDLMMKHRAIAT